MASWLECALTRSTTSSSAASPARRGWRGSPPNSGRSWGCPGLAGGECGSASDGPRRCRPTQLRALLNRVGDCASTSTPRSTGCTPRFRANHLRQLVQVENAMGRQAVALIQQLVAACRSAGEPATVTEELFLTHPDVEVITSFPGLSTVSGARVLAEIGDDRSQFTDAKTLKAYTRDPSIWPKPCRCRPNGEEPTHGLCRLHVGLSPGSSRGLMGPDHAWARLVRHDRSGEPDVRQRAVGDRCHVE